MTYARFKEIVIPRMDTSRGAPLGRFNINELSRKTRMHCRHITVSAEGYDYGGAYWGVHPDALYCIFSPCGKFKFYVRGRLDGQSQRYLHHWALNSDNIIAKLNRYK